MTSQVGTFQLCYFALFGLFFGKQICRHIASGPGQVRATRNGHGLVLGEVWRTTVTCCLGTWLLWKQVCLGMLCLGLFMSWEDPGGKQAGFLPLGTSVSQGREGAPYHGGLPGRGVASACQAVGSGLSHYGAYDPWSSCALGGSGGGGMEQ